MQSPGVEYRISRYFALRADVEIRSNMRIWQLPGLKLTAIRGAKILGTAKPGEIIRFEARLLGRMGNLVQAQATASINGRTVLQVELTLGGEPLASSA